MPDLQAPILDFGCGTGLSGLALNQAGCRVIDGVDVSEGMLAQARAKGVYRTLDAIAEDDPMTDRAGRYAAVAAIGVIGAGAAPLAVFDRLWGLLPTGGLFGFSFNDHTLEDPAYEARVDALIAAGDALSRHREDGPHLPSERLNSVVHVLEKA
jgi:predicted TPR repeat methyltransferase